jgi:hypothetical protein
VYIEADIVAYMMGKEGMYSVTTHIEAEIF